MAKENRTKNDPDAPSSSTKLRRAAEEERATELEYIKRENRNFVQVYPEGWRQMQLIIQKSPQALRLYMLIAANIDSAGVIVATQDVLAETLNVSKKTIQRHSAILEDAKALIRIPLQGGIYAYAMNPEEIWKNYDKRKEWAPFYTKSLSQGPSRTGIVKRKAQIMVREKLSFGS
jgi:hypothetical protein